MDINGNLYNFLDVTTSGELGWPAKPSVPFEESESYSGASAIWKMTPSSLGHRLEAGWFRKECRAALPSSAIDIFWRVN